MSNNKKPLDERISDTLSAMVRMIVVRTTDREQAVHDALTAAKAHSDTEVKIITSASKPVGADGKELPGNQSAMNIIETHKKTGKGILIGVNILHTFGSSPMAQAILSDLAAEVRDEPAPKLILVESISTAIPSLLKDHIELINVENPDVEAQEKETLNFIRAMAVVDPKDTGNEEEKMAKAIARVRERILPGNGEALRKVAESICGVDGNIGSRTLSQCMVEMGRLDPTWLSKAKAHRVKEMFGGILKIVEPGFTKIGGQGPLMQWARMKAKAFLSAKAAAFGVSCPKGVFLTGVQGCGKTLFGKWIAEVLGVPVIWFDLGACMGKHVGDSESTLRAAIDAIESMAPNVVIMDECDKSLAGATGPSGDSGTTQRMFGALLTWLSERTKPVFIVATSNDAESLPAEFMRPGRFDDIFFIDLPNEQERMDIFSIHLANNKMNGINRDPSKCDCLAIAKATEGFSGVEMEQVVKSGVDLAFYNDKTDVETSDFLEAAKNIRPLSRVQSAKINKLRDWAKERGIKMAGASEPTKTDAPATTSNGTLKRNTVIDFNKKKGE